MIIWLLYFVLSLVFMALCYPTNPIVVLFANKDGELPSLLKYWQTWDNSCYCSESVENAPKFLRYDWSKHYREYKDADSYLKTVNRERWYCVCIDDDFSIIERVQRYFCAVLWLTRNCAYGFGFYLLGLTVSPTLEIKQSEHTLFIKEVFGNGLFGAWSYKNTAPIFKVGDYTVFWENFLGWKIKADTSFDTRAMVANRIALRFRKAAAE